MNHGTRTGGWGRIGIVGAAGLIGSGLAAGLASVPACRSLHLLDVRTAVLRSHIIDIGEAQAHSGAIGPVLYAHGPEDAPVVDLVVVAASAPETAEHDRTHFLAENLAIMTTLVPTILRMAGDGAAVLVLSNPVDELAEALHRMSGLDPRRIIGYNLNDSVRFRLAVARELNVEPSRIDGWVLGRHGSGQVPLFSRLRLDEEQLTLADPARSRVSADIDGWFGRWTALRSGRSSGWATAAGVLRTITAMHDGRPHPASVWTGDVPGLAPTYIGMPAVLTPAGMTEVEDWRYANDEWLALQLAARTVYAGTRLRQT